MTQLIIPQPYQPIRLLGKGRFGDVYLVRDQTQTAAQDAAFYACKTAVTGSARAMLCKEATIQKQVNHPIFAKFHKLLENDTGTFLIMEYIQGVPLIRMCHPTQMPVPGHMNPLPQLLDAVQTQTPPRTYAYNVLDIAVSLAEGLYYLHNRLEPILYRDMKPEHVILTEKGVRLLDLGCACPLHEANASRAGTPGFAAPEQLYMRPKDSLIQTVRNGTDSENMFECLPAQTWRQDKYSQDKCSDIYGFGKILCYMFKNMSLTPELEYLIGQCTAENPQERMPDIYPVLHALRTLTDGEKTSKYAASAISAFTVRKCVYKIASNT